jgi:hypothetical protein
MSIDIEMAEEAANQQYMQQMEQERQKRLSALYDKMVDSDIFESDELSLARFEFGL